MSAHISTEIKINASASQVWDVLVDFQKYPEWNSFITSMEGKPAQGARLKAKILGTQFKPVVLQAKENQVFEWLGRLLVPGLFDGQHKFELIENQDGTTTLIQSESFSGILVPLFKKMLETDTLNGFRSMNEGLKLRAESTD